MNTSTIRTLIAIAFCTLVFSCSKKNNPPITPPPPSYPIVGIWVGSLTADNEPSAGALYYKFDIRSDSTIVTESQGADGKSYTNHGTWTLNGSSFHSITTSDQGGIIQTQSAIYSSTKATLTSGVWQNQSGDAKGKFSLTRSN